MKDGWTTTCKLLGFLEQVTSWMGPLCLLWLVLYIIYIALDHKMVKKTEVSRSELVGIGLCLLSPFTFNLLPFINGYYGFSDSWCWITIPIRGKCYNENILMSLIYMVILYYGPLIVFVLINTIACIIIFHIW